MTFGFAFRVGSIALVRKRDGKVRVTTPIKKLLQLSWEELILPAF